MIERFIRWHAAAACYDTRGRDRPHRVAIDSTRRLAFVGCESNAKSAVFDLTARSVTSLHHVGSTPDVLVLDPDWNLVYVAAERGPLTVFADSNGVDPQTHHLFTPLANVGGATILREMAMAAPAE
jgi:hypothetical protein